ncbi:MAG TPA: alpha-amylase family glycosyl hydrolase [Flavisolibacter sp.]|nr:alpha-amylase family glycosyl hydrolase [Flavisolibacter sp.]
MKRFFALLTCFSAVWISSCTNEGGKTAGLQSAQPDTAMIDGHPAWIMQGNIYEVNVRQYTPEGTFNAFAKHLPRLRDMGVQTLWFMPVQPIGIEGRKGSLGSYYAISDYKGINPEFGTMTDWKTLVDSIHAMGMKVIIDWVPNHTSPDHPWVKNHPEFYLRDSVTGIPIHPPGTDWTDVRKLDFRNNTMADSMIAAMKFWITETGIDGFRCDHAQGPGLAFWKKCNAELRKTKNLLLLAESEDDWIYEAGFDMSYPWKFFHLTKAVAAGKYPASALDSVLHVFDTSFPASATFLHFTSNHDENSWNKAEYATMPGASHAPFAVLTQTVGRSVPLIYSGQEEPFLDSISFFYKDTISFGQYQRGAFYKTLLNLRKNNSALAANAPFRKLRTNKDNAIYAFERGQGSNKVLVVLNLSKDAQEFSWTDQPSDKEWNNIFAGSKEPVDKGFGIEPWGYAVYELRK